MIIITQTQTSVETLRLKKGHMNWKKAQFPRNAHPSMREKKRLHDVTAKSHRRSQQVEKKLLKIFIVCNVQTCSKKTIQLSD